MLTHKRRRMVFIVCLLSLLEQLDMNVRNRPRSFIIIAKLRCSLQRSNSVFQSSASWITMRKTPLVWHPLGLQNKSRHVCSAAWRPRTTRQKLQGGKDSQHVASLGKRKVQLEFPLIALLSKKQIDHDKKRLNINTKGTQMKIKCVFHAKYLLQTDKKKHHTFFWKSLSVTNRKREQHDNRLETARNLCKAQDRNVL